MLTHGSILVSLLWLVEQIPTPPPPAKRKRGRQETYSDKLFVKALIVMIIRRLYTAWALLHFLEQDDPVAQQDRMPAEHRPGRPHRKQPARMDQGRRAPAVATIRWARSHRRAAGRLFLDARHVFAGTGVDADEFIDVDEQGHPHHRAGFQRGRLAPAARGVAAHAAR